MKIKNYLLMLLTVLATAACSDADVASSNLSKAADNFEVNRRIVFYNGVTGDYILVIEGLCSLGNQDPDHKLTVTCKQGDDKCKKHFLGLSDNVTFFAEQIESSAVDSFHYRVIFKPQSVVPDIEIKTQ